MTRERGIKGNTVSYTTALHACATSKDWKSALEVLDMMKEDKIFIVPFARNCALQALAEAPAEVAERGLDPWLGARKEKVNTFSEKKMMDMNNKNHQQKEEATTVTVNNTTSNKNSSNNNSSNKNDDESPMDLLQDPPTPASYKEQKKW